MQFIQCFAGSSLSDVTDQINKYIKSTNYRVVTMTMSFSDNYVNNHRVLVCFER